MDDGGVGAEVVDAEGAVESEEEEAEGKMGIGF